MSVDNLKPFNELTESEQRAIAKKGGKASGVARRKKADLKKAFETILTADVTSNKLRDQLVALGYDSTNEMALALIMMQKAMKGDVKAFEQIAKMTTDRKDALDRKEQRAKIRNIELDNERRHKELSGIDETEDALSTYLDKLGGVIDES